MTSILLSFVLAQAQPATVPSDDIVAWILGSIKWIVEQIQQKNYLPAVGMMIVLIVFAVQKVLGDKVNSKYLPWLSAAFGILTTVAANLVALKTGSTSKDWVSVIVSGFVVGASASGLWSMLGKAILGKIFPDKPTVPVVAPAVVAPATIVTTPADPASK